MSASVPNDVLAARSLLKRDATGPESAQVQQSYTSMARNLELTTARIGSFQELPEKEAFSSSTAEKRLVTAKTDNFKEVQENESGRASVTARTDRFPELPNTIYDGGFYFEPATCSSLMEVAAPNCLRCHTNATRNLQGVCFLNPPVLRGERAQIRIRLDNKPGRMRYFLGIARQRFGDASDIALRKAGWSIENLYAGPHSENAPCNTKTTPLFHTGSVVTIVVDLTEPSSAEVSFAVDTTNACFRQRLPKNLQKVEFWVSLYNRFAQFSVLD